MELERRSIGVFNLNGQFYALRNSCPHEGGPLCRGVLSGFLTSREPGEYTYVRQGEVLRCPWHQWEFDVRTGQSWIDPKQTRVRSYETKVASGTTLMAEETDPGMQGLVKGPYVADTVTVRVDGRYVVLEL